MVGSGLRILMLRDADDAGVPMVAALMVTE
jgi:hypothetical protein